MYFILTASILFAADIEISLGESIQSAIDSASENDVIILSAGTYTECLNTSGKILTIRGFVLLMNSPFFVFLEEK